MALVPKQWYADAKPNARNNYVEILARKSGFFAWFLALIKVDPTFFMSISQKQVVYQASNFVGYRKIVLPVDSISSSYFGYHKPWVAAIVIFLLSIMAGSAIFDATQQAMWGMLAMLIGLVIAVVYYFLNKQLLIGITDDTGSNYSLILKRSVIEGTDINEQQMELVTQIILTVVDNQKARKLVSPAPAVAPAHQGG